MRGLDHLHISVPCITFLLLTGGEMEYRDLIKNHKSFMAFILLAKEVSHVVTLQPPVHSETVTNGRIRETINLHAT